VAGVGTGGAANAAGGNGLVQICYSFDTDGDGVANQFDLDSDGDGCSDAFEAGSVAAPTNTSTIPTGTDTNGNGLLNSYESTTAGVINYRSRYAAFALNGQSSACLDSDTDSVPDLNDIDDDNDGVLDETEQINCVVSGIDLNNLNFSGSAITNRTINTIATAGGDAWKTSYSNENLKLPITLTYKFNSTTGYAMFGLFPVTGTQNAGTWADGAYKFYPVQTNVYGYFQFPGGNWDFGPIAITPADVLSIDINATGYVTAKVNNTVVKAFQGVRSDYKLNMSSYRAANFTNVVLTDADNLSQKSCTDIDTDADGVPNRLDLDSDGDGCPDVREAGISTTLTSGSVVNKSGNTTTTTTVANAVISGIFGANGFANSIETGAESGVYSGTYTYDFASDANVNSCLDTDSDGVPNMLDIDDDNDGVLDVTEYNCEVSTMSKTGITVSSTVTWGYNGGTTLNNLVNGTEDLTAYTTGDFLNQTILQFNLPSAKVLEQIEVSTQSGLTTLGTTGTYNLEGWNGTTWVIIEKNKTFGSPSAPIRAPGNTYKFLMPNNLTAYTKYRIFGTSAKGTFNSSSWIQEAYFFERTCNTDVDNDGVANWLDSDSDGDGCPDAVESGATAISTSGVASNARLSASTIPAPYSANGFATGLETTAGNGVYKGTYSYNMAVDAAVNACTDTDSDGVANALDLDDDNDGVLDVTELNCAISIVAKTGISVSSTVGWGYNSTTLANLVNGKEDLTAYSTTDFIDQTILQFDFTAAKALSLIEISTQNSGATLGTTGKYNVQRFQMDQYFNEPNFCANRSGACTSKFLHN
jgi:hypothetical protein